MELVPPRQLLADAEHVYEVTRQHPKVDPARIVLFGQSQGATIAPQLALAHPEVAGLVLQAAPAGTDKDGWAQFYHEVALPFLREVADVDGDGLLTLEEVLDAQREEHGDALDLLFANLLEPPEPATTQQFYPGLDQNGDGLLDIEQEYTATIDYMLAHFEEYPGPRRWSRGELPPVAAALPGYRKPILLQQGEHDAHVLPSDARQLAAALAASCHPDYTVRLYPGLGHGLGPAPSRYQDMLVPIAPGPLADLTLWLNQRYKNGAGGAPASPSGDVPSSPARPPAPAARGTPTGDRVLFEDDFADPASGWLQSQEASYRAGYERDGYRLAIGVPDKWLVGANVRVPVTTDVYVDVDVTKRGGADTPGNGYGVLCRYRDVANYYVLRIFSYGGYGIYRAQEGVEFRLGGSAGFAHTAIRQGNATNHLRVECVGDTMRLNVNGQQVAEVRDDAPVLIPGRVALYASTGVSPDSSIDAVFANLVVCAPAQSAPPSR
jgi:pimeloyl-ACP methyl ester carboxylesterase